jgi:hypothetical protein
MAKGIPLRPGQPTPASGIYAVLGPHGGKTGHEVTSVIGHPLPPTPRPHQVFVPVDLANDGAGRAKK